MYSKSQNDDSTATARSSYSSAHPITSIIAPINMPNRPVAGRTAVVEKGLSTNLAQVSNQTPVPVASRSSRQKPLRATERTNFARLDGDGSDDFSDNDGNYSPPTKLGKRDRLSPSNGDLPRTRQACAVVITCLRQ